MTIKMLTSLSAAQHLAQFREVRPLVHCMTNEVVQEITANVLLAAGASPAMVVSREEVESFAKISTALLINVGTPASERLPSMFAAAKAANEAGVAWALDPVAAGVLPWRDEMIGDFLELKPTVVRGNASEIMALMVRSAGGKGVDSLNSSSEAIDAAKEMANTYNTIVCVTGETDYITDGDEVVGVSGGHLMTTLVVGTGCSLSALVAAFAGVERSLESVATACLLSKRAAEYALPLSKGPGTFHTNYLDGLYLVTPTTLAAKE